MSSGSPSGGKSGSVGDTSQLNEIKQMFASLQKTTQGTNKRLEEMDKRAQEMDKRAQETAKRAQETNRNVTQMHDKVSSLLENSARKEIAGRYGKMFAKPLHIRHPYGLVKHLVECGVAKADTIEELRSHETIIIQACLPPTQPLKYVDLLVERVQDYVKNSSRLFLTTFRERGEMPSPGAKNNHWAFFDDSHRANPTALKMLAEWMKSYNGVFRHLTPDALIVDGVVSADGLRTAITELYNDGLATKEQAGVEKRGKEERNKAKEAERASGKPPSTPSTESPAVLWKRIEQVLRSDKNGCLLDFAIALNATPVSLNDDNGTVDAASLRDFLDFASKGLNPLHDGVQAKSRQLGLFLQSCEEKVKKERKSSVQVDSSQQAQTEEAKAKAELGMQANAASATLSAPEFGKVFIMLLMCAAQHDTALQRLRKTNPDATEVQLENLPKELPLQELEIDVGGRITYLGKRLYVSVGEVKSGERRVKGQAKNQLRTRTLVLGYAAKCLLVAQGQQVEVVDREGVIIAPKRTQPDGGDGVDSGSDTASNADEAEQDREDGIVFTVERL